MIENVNLTHGIVVQGAEVYVSTQLEVLLYEFGTDGDGYGGGVVGGWRGRTPKVIVSELPSDGGSYVFRRMFDAGPCYFNSLSIPAPRYAQ